MSDSLLPNYNERFKSILIFGPPGSGKGTLGKFLGNAGNYFHLSSGDIFRGLSPESPAGKLFHQYASNGHLLPDDATIQIWKHYVDGLIATNRYSPKQQTLLMDGIPRTANQAAILDDYIEVSHIIVLEMHNLEGLLQRMRKRALLERRMDDADEAVLKKRMDVYQKETLQLLGHYPSHLISRFNADQKPLEVLRDVLIKLTSL